MAGGDMSQRGGAPAAAPRRAARAPWPGRAHLPLGRRRPNWRTLTRHNISSKAPRQNVTTCSLRADLAQRVAATRCLILSARAVIPGAGMRRAANVACIHALDARGRDPADTRSHGCAPAREHAREDAPCPRRVAAQGPRPRGRGYGYVDMSFAQEWKPTPSELRGEDGSTPAGAATGPAAAAVRANVCRPRAAAPRARVALGRCVLPRGPEGRERPDRDKGRR
ncbi:unnamed protein product [Prorocentrum cordatum]|uniref:Uncharacterized protein n=1 Tax=Prorocentrum cordatum TaxID=2364126 RepID=A0ABN9YHJ2_9DINO|nr:unnamed protein product [Polarella glacialis]